MSTFVKPTSAPTVKNLKIKKNYVQKSTKKQEAIDLIPANTKVPISKTWTERLKLAFQHHRINNKSVKEKIAELQSEIKKIIYGSYCRISRWHGYNHVRYRSIQDIILHKVFLEEQQKYLNSSSTEIRCHTMINIYYLSFTAKSFALMTKFGMMKRNSTGFLILPSHRRLQDYKNYFKPERGFTPNIMYDLYKVKYFSDKE